jgi:hypothetical protein
MASGLQSNGVSCTMVLIAVVISLQCQICSRWSLVGVCCGDAAAVVSAAERHYGIVTALLSSVLSTVLSPP